MAKDGKYGVTLSAAAEFAARQKGLRIEDCAVGDVVTVVTSNNVYTLHVLDPAQRRVMADGSGEHFSPPEEAFVNGSSMTGTGAMVRLGWIGVGFRLWLNNLLLTETRRVLVNGELYQDLPEDGTSTLN